MAAHDSLGPQFVSTHALYAGVEPEVKNAHEHEGDEAAWHEGKIQQLHDSISSNGYRLEMAPGEPIIAFKHPGGVGVLEGRHRVVAAYHAGVEKLPVEWDE